MFPLIIAAVDEIYFNGEVSSVTLPGSEGELTVLKDHEPFVSILKSGTITVRGEMEAGEKQFSVEKGILEVHRGGMTVLL